MRWPKSDLRKSVVIIIGTMLLLTLVIVLLGLFGVGSHPAQSSQTGTGIVQPTPTIDATAVALDIQKQNDEKLQRDNSGIWPWLNAIGGSALLAIAAIVSTIIGFSQWRGNQNAERRKELAARAKESNDRKEAQDKELREQAEERFQTAIAALGNANEATQVGGAILLRSFLHKEDKKPYGRYYTQIFDLAVAYLRPSNAPKSSEDSNVSMLLTPLRQALSIVLLESFSLAREDLGSIESSLETRSLDASHINLDEAFLAEADLRFAWLLEASFRKTNFINADLSNAFLFRANFHEGTLPKARFNGAALAGADFTDADLREAEFRSANLSRAVLTNADLSNADLTGADLTNAKLKGTDLRSVEGLTREQLEAYEAKGAVINKRITVNTTISTALPPSQSNDAQALSATPAQVTTPPAITDGSSSTSAQLNPEP